MDNNKYKQNNNIQVSTKYHIIPNTCELKLILIRAVDLATINN